MVKGRHGKPKLKKGGFGSIVNNDVKVISDEPIFQRALHSSDQDTDSPFLLTLLFHDKVSQHSALARIEAFYESSSIEAEGESSNRFLTIDQAKTQRLCPNYEAFNCPIYAINEWLAQMLKTENVFDKIPKIEESSTESVMQIEKWWQPYCNEEESELLTFLDALGCLQDPTIGPDTFVASRNAPQYLITSLASQASESLPHERLHFLYFASKEYREYVRNLYESLTNKTRKIIESDLGLRGYAAHVWQDEFQAYITFNSAEFGNPTKSECSPLQQLLKQKQRLIWKQVNTPSTI